MSIYLGVSVDFIRWDKELEEGVLLSWCSGVVSGPSMLTENRTDGCQSQAASRRGPEHSPKWPRRSYFCRGWSSSWSFRLSGDPGWATHFPCSQTGSSNPPALTAGVLLPGDNAGEERIGVISQLNQEAHLNPPTNSQPNYDVACSRTQRWLGLAHLGLTFGVL